MSLSSNIFHFAKFTLDAGERALLENGKPVPITPKAFHLLSVLVERRGKIVEKEILISAVWPDSFVEESSLTFNIRQLRKILGDSKDNSLFIETVARRGYRFIAEVRKGSTEEDSSSRSFFPPNERGSVGLARSVLPVAAFVLTCVVAAAGFWYAKGSTRPEGAPILSAEFSSEKLSTDGKTVYAVISADGKNVVYLNRGGKDGVWLRQLESGNNVEIIPPSNDVYAGFALSPGGDLLYFGRRLRNFDGQVDIYRVPILGGIPTRIISEAQGWIGLSPDGNKISFVRCYYRDDDFCSLWIADSADGKNERMLAMRPRPIRIGANQISPDGKSIAFAFGQSENAGNEFGLAEIDIESGVERALTTEQFFNIKYLTWLPNRAGLLFTASKIPNKHFRIWKLSAVDGTAKPLTKDSETYSALSLNKEANILVSTQVKQDFHLFISGIQNPTLSRNLTEGATVTFAPDGKIIFSSSISGNDEIWSVNSDGSGQKQLTNNGADESAPAASPDGRSIFFSSNRTGKVHVWRMNADGSGQVQVTQKEGGFPLSVSPDGNWLYYTSGTKRTLMRVAIQSGEEQLILKKGCYRYAISPDGSAAAYSEIVDGEKRLTIASLPDGKIIKTFPVGDSDSKIAEVAWLPSGTEILYIIANSEFEGNTLWRQPLGGGKPRQIAKIGNEEVWDLAVSPDTKSLAIVKGRWEHDSVLIRGFK
jgi:DNA-binding winged helix-turn-helix (wHTH) protein/Tol biopolymer transport system component